MIGVRIFFCPDLGAAVWGTIHVSRFPAKATGPPADRFRSAGVAQSGSGHACRAANPPSAAHSALRIYDIPAQDLAGALLGFGQQSGLQVGAPSPLLAGKQAPRVQGRMSAVQALDQILAGSGLVWRVEAQGVRIVAPEREAGMLELGNTLVQGRQTLPMGTQVVGRQQIEGLPAGNGDITSLLKLNPNVQFDDAQLSSKTPGEIAPANISINGAKFYQNALVVDGMNINNNIDRPLRIPACSTRCPAAARAWRWTPICSKK